ncbi:hypothetical protein EDD18DRAFT_1026025, partial [Armillaria luteobubalina]
MLIWIKGVMSPQDVRDNILDPKSNFQKRMVEWLEGCHMGELFNGSQSEVQAQVENKKMKPGYVDPTKILPIAPPNECTVQLAHKNCPTCNDTQTWHQTYQETVDDLIVRSNIHDCEKYINKDGSTNKNKTYMGCKENKYNKCKARFPRLMFTETQVDPESGAVRLKKGEPWINMFTAALTYVMRCNTDITNLSSGTVIKAVILYVSNYITKTPLKTHMIFEVIRDMFDK